MRVLRFAGLSFGISALGVFSASAACDVGHGAELFQSKCSICHQLGKNAVGPDLVGVVGRKVATSPGFRYSDALRKAGGTWTAALLDKWLAGPEKLYPGTAMAFSGFTEATDRADVICYLEKVSIRSGTPNRAAQSTSRKAGELQDRITGKAASELATVRREVGPELQRIETLWASGDAKTMADTLYAKNAIIAGEGQKGAVRGQAAIETLLGQLIGENSAVQIQIDAAYVLSNNALATWVTWTVTPRNGSAAFKMRSLLLWWKHAGHWQILSDSYSAGRL